MKENSYTLIKVILLTEIHFDFLLIWNNFLLKSISFRLVCWLTSRLVIFCWLDRCWCRWPVAMELHGRWLQWPFVMVLLINSWLAVTIITPSHLSYYEIICSSKRFDASDCEKVSNWIFKGHRDWNWTEPNVKSNNQNGQSIYVDPSTFTKEKWTLVSWCSCGLRDNQFGIEFNPLSV